MGTIVFEEISSQFQILNPFNNFARESHKVTVRRDPLLGDTSVYNPYLKDKVKAFFGPNDPDLIRTLAEESAKTCIFCGENVFIKTARYPVEAGAEGRIRRGEAVLFANLFSVGAYHPVIALGKRHFLKLSEFTPQLIADGLGAAQDFLRSAYRKDESARFAAISANYLFPAGASLVHPHLQMLITPVAYSYQSRLLNAVDGYREKNGTSYFDDLVKEEKVRGSRFVAEADGWRWLAAFSPMGSNEITAVHEKTRDAGSLSGRELQALSLGISKVLRLYEELGHLSFNYTLFSVRENAGSPGFRCLFKIISRQNLYPNYRNDDYFLQKMLQSELILNLPEELAAALRKMW